MCGRRRARSIGADMGIRANEVLGAVAAALDRKEAAIKRAEEEKRCDPHLMDSDGDGLTDAEELALGTDPFSWDTDGDGLGDSLEVRQGTDPRRRG